MEAQFKNHLMKMEMAKRGWQLIELAKYAGLSEPTARAVLRGRSVSMVAALKVVREVERNPPNERLIALPSWREAHPKQVVPSQLVTASDR